MLGVIWYIGREWEGVVESVVGDRFRGGERVCEAVSEIYSLP